MYYSNWDILRVKENASNNETMTTDMKWDSPRQTKTYGHPCYKELAERKTTAERGICGSFMYELD